MRAFVSALPSLLSALFMASCGSDASPSDVAQADVESTASDLGNTGDTAADGQPVPPEDSVASPDDTVTPVEDTVTPPEDTVAPPDDTVTPVEDTATSPEDTVMPLDETEGQEDTDGEPRSLCERVHAGEIIPGVKDIRRDFGATGDGTTDDFDAMQAAADYATSHPGTTIVYPKGTYRIDRYNDLYYGTDPAFPIQNDPQADLAHRTIGVSYDFGHDFKIIGCEAKIDVKGDFHKNATFNYGALFPPDPKLYYQPAEWQKSAFSFYHSHDFEVQGFEIDGNVDQMTADPRVNMESRDHGVYSTNSHDYVLQDLRVHHFASDGLMLGHGALDYNITIDNVESSSNARQGLSLIQTSSVTVTRSRFRGNGQTRNEDTGLTTFGPLNTSNTTGFGPSAGVDVEPDCKLPVGAVGHCPGYDVRGKNIVFSDCEFTDNLGWGLAHGHCDVVEGITVTRSTFRNPPGHGATPLLLCSGTASDNVIYAERGYVWLINGLSQPDDAIVFRDNVVHGTNQLLRADGSISRVLVEGNTFFWENGGAFATWKLFELIDRRESGTPTWEALRNRLVIAPGAFPVGYGNDTVNFSRLAASLGNRIETSSPTRWYFNYNGTLKIDDVFTTARLPDGFEPTHGALGPLGDCYVPEGNEFRLMWGVPGAPPGCQP